LIPRGCARRGAALGGAAPFVCPPRPRALGGARLIRRRGIRPGAISGGNFFNLLNGKGIADSRFPGNFGKFENMSTICDCTAFPGFHPTRNSFNPEMARWSLPMLDNGQKLRQQ